MPLNLILTQAGNYTIEDDGVPGNGSSVIEDGAGVLTPFAHPADSLTITASSINVNVTLNFVDSLGAASFTLGNLLNTAQSPNTIFVKNIVSTGTVTLSAVATIAGQDIGTDVVAGQLLMSAGSGIGAPGNALEVQTGVLGAGSTTSGIVIRNFGSVQIGGGSAAIAGLHVETSGNIDFSTLGTILLGDETGSESVRGGSNSGNVSLTALGFDADIIANVDNDAISAPGGNIGLTSGRDIAFGIIGSNFDNDVRARGGISIDAGRDFLVDGFADISSDDFAAGTGGNVIINAGRNIHLRNVAGTDGSILASGNAGADAILTTGAGGALVLDAASAYALSSNSGDVTVNADRVLISAASGITANAGQVTLRPATAGSSIGLGVASDTQFGLSDAELDRISTSSLVIGSYSTGSITVASVLSPANAANLTLQSGGGISLQSSITVTGTLTLIAGDDVHVFPGGAINAAGLNILADRLGNDGNTGATINLSSIGGSFPISVTGSGDSDDFTGSGGADTLNGAGGADILRGGGGADTLSGGAGADQMSGGLGDDRFIADNAGDKVFEAAGQGNDIVYASASYTLAASQHIELLATGSQAGTTAINLTGNELAQRINGNDGANTIYGMAGDDTLVGYGGNDWLNGGAGVDTLYGGLGDDSFVVDNAGDKVFEAAGQGDDIVYASVNYSLAASQHIELLATSSPAGTTAINLVGNELAQRINGNDGANSIYGMAGNDTLVGYGGNDWIKGGSGNDTLIGGTGQDNFVFDSALNAATNVDQVTDFNVAQDTIRLDNAVMPGLGATLGTLATGKFWKSTAGVAHDADDRIIYDTDTGRLFYDSNGDAAGGATHFATLAPNLALTNADFVVI